MIAPLQFCQKCCQPLQNKLEFWVPTIPKDTVWSMVKSSLYSGAISIIMTQGDWMQGAVSANLAALTVLIYALAVALYERWRPGKESIRHEALVISVLIAALIAEYVKIQALFKETFVATSIPYAFTYNQPSTPVLGMVFLVNR